MGSSGSHDHNSAEILRHVTTALNLGQVERAREMAHSVYNLSAADYRNEHTQAHALLCLAHCDLMVSRFRRSQETAQRAATLFQSLSDHDGESHALTVLSRAAAFLGRNEEAVEAALLAVQLTQSMPACRTKARATHALGVAYYFSRSFEKAEATLEDTVQIARQSQPVLSSYQPRLDQAFAEAVRNVKARYLNEYLPKTRRMQTALELCAQFAESDDSDSHITQGEVVWGRAAWHLLQGLKLCWAGRLSEGEAQLSAAREWTSRYQTTTSLQALEWWLQTETAWARGHWSHAEEHVARMIEVATRVEHEQLACVGHLLASEIFEAQGKSTLALEEQRRLRRRELRNRAESLESRSRMVGAQFDARRTEQSLQLLQASSQELTRLAMEDTLTGVGNRRAFERKLELALRQGADASSPLSLAMLDVDDFKKVNDAFSHLTGDQVLQQIARILASQVREHDIVARIGGDEFMVIFPSTDQDIAAQACQRIREAIALFAWEGIAKGLSLAVSVGVVQSIAGDTVESLLHRSDVAMYGSKKVRSPL